MAKKSKVLGHDPFANGDSPLAEEGVGLPENSKQKTAESSPAEAQEETKDRAEVPAEAPPAAEGPALSETEGPVLSETEGPALDQAEEQSETEPAEAAADTEVERVIVAEPDEEASHLLDELMATIDQEVEETFGPGAMADLVPEEAVGAAGEEQYVIFSLAGSEYAVPADNVREIGEPPNVTPVPNVPDWVLGVTNLRGDVLSLVDLSLFLSIERTDYSEDTRVMVVHAQQDTSSVTTGLIVDRVSDIRYLSVDQIVVPTAPIEDQVASYLHGVYEGDGRLLVVLNLDRLLLSPEMRQFEPV
jgi:purine-binding chemotaxis protein CheW